MPLDADTRARIATLIDSNPVILFMKGTRERPQCGFSAQTVEILDGLIPDYQTFDVLSDPAVREGIKEYSSWPTIPQLYVKGELIGGCDIVRDLYASGELFAKLGVPEPERVAPELVITDAAAEALQRAAEQSPDAVLHLKIDARFENGIYLGPALDGEVEVESNGVRVRLDPASAQRARGVTIDVTSTERGPAFTIRNPNANA
ncbi:MAG: Grx4 family monothiol glutaredoxin [Deltaproteobacteria bacterium]|nr:MAG: Grx4 family monothiol glutaredoxin [Deltaproteobacteria bacterium]